MSNYKLLKDGTVAQGMVELTEDGKIASPVPFFQQDLIGSARNWYPDKIRGVVFGKRTAVENVAVTLWSGPTNTYVFPPSPMQMSISSTSESDSAAGTGIRQMAIYYLDTNYIARSEIITLNGLTPVNTVATNILRINSMHSIATGSANSAVGVISLNGGGVTYSILQPFENTTRQAVYTVPAGLTGYISHWQASSGSTGNHFVQTVMAATTVDGENYPGVFLIQDEVGTQNGNASITFPIPIPIPEKTDVSLFATADAPNAGCFVLGAIMGWFEPIV